MTNSDYHPLLDTLRLYAGWLLACLFAVFALGSYQELRELPWEAAIMKEWVESQMILQVMAVTFFFLALSSLHRVLGSGFWKGVVLCFIGFVLLVVFRMNT